MSKDTIFWEDGDYLYYLWKMRQFRSKYKVDIIAYSLLQNHYHQLLMQLSDVPINKFLTAVNTSYGGYFNRKYRRVGPLVQDRFKQVIIENDEHFYRMSVYINCNYEIHGLGMAKNYRWSSYQDYLRLRNGTLCNKERVMVRFPEKYGKFCDKLIVEFMKEKFLEME